MQLRNGCILGCGHVIEHRFCFGGESAGVSIPAPHVQDGREAVLNVLAKRIANHPETSISIKRTASNGDLVVIRHHVKRTPEDLGRAVVNIFRMENGKFGEHWNVIQPVPETSRNDNTMF